MHSISISEQRETERESKNAQIIAEKMFELHVFKIQSNGMKKWAKSYFCAYNLMIS